MPLRLRYARELRVISSRCRCGQQYNVNQALICKRGGFVIIRHSNRDFEANLIKQVHSDVEVEPHLQPMNGENINGLTGDDARSDIRARSIWRNGQNVFFDIIVMQTLMQTLTIIYHPSVQ